MTALKAAATAPDFTLHSTPNQMVSLSDLGGKPVVPVFYNADRSSVCSDSASRQGEQMKDTSTLTPVMSARDHAKGGADAPLALVKYGDYQSKLL